MTMVDFEDIEVGDELVRTGGCPKGRVGDVYEVVDIYSDSFKVYHPEHTTEDGTMSKGRRHCEYFEFKDDYSESDDYDNIIQRADALVDGDRQEDYGHPSEDFSRIAKMWSGYLNDKLKDGERIKPADVPLMMIHLKTSRLANKRTEDEATDIAGYAKTFEMTLDELEGGFE